MRAVKRNKKPVKLNRRWKNVIKGVNASFDDRLGGGNVIMWGLKGRGRYLNAAALPENMYPVEDGISLSDGYDSGGGGSYYYDEPAWEAPYVPLPITTQLAEAAADYAVPAPAVTYQEPVLHAETEPVYFQEQVAPVVDYIDPVIGAEPLHITWDDEPVPTKVEAPIPFDNSQLLGTSEPVTTAPTTAPAIEAANTISNILSDISSKLGMSGPATKKLPVTEDNSGMYIAGGIAAIGILALLFKK